MTFIKENGDFGSSVHNYGPMQFLKLTKFTYTKLRQKIIRVISKQLFKAILSFLMISIFWSIQ